MEDNTMPKIGMLDFTAVRRATSFEAVLEYYGLEAEKPGQKQLKLRCPFHEDKTPSCSVNPEKGIFNCFGCPAEGNVLDFIALKEGYKENPTYKASVKAVEIIGGNVIDFKKGSDSAPEGEEPEKHPKAAPSGAKAPTATPSPSEGSSDGEPNPVITVELDLEPDHPFLAARGVTPEVAEAFGIGFCAKGIMRSRIAIPLHNAEGELVAFSGRYANEPVPQGTERYKLPKQFQKSLELFNLHRAIAMKKRYVIVVEGYWSVIRLHQAGIPAVALMGTSVSQHQAALLREHGFKFATLLLDGDDAGRKAAVTAAHVLSQHVYVHTLDLPDGVGPDDMDEELVDRLRR